MNDDISKRFFKSKESNDHSNSNQSHKKYMIDEIIYTIILNGKESDGKYSLVEITFPSEKEKRRYLYTNMLKKI